MTTIGMVGIGHMGFPMMDNLLKAGYELIVFDLNAEALERAVAKGAQLAPTIPALANKADIVLTMLQTGQQVESVCLGEEGLFAHMTPQSLFIDSSTIDASHSRQLHDTALAAGHTMLDAPVSGGVAAAEKATLTFMVGGEPDAFSLAEPILKHMGAKIVHTGPAGTGVVAKICNNMLLGISMIGVCESFVLAKSLGLSPDKLFDVMKDASGQCWSLTSYCPEPGLLPDVPSSHGYQPGFTAAMMLKDLNLSAVSAEEAGVTLPLGQVARDLYDQFVKDDHAELDFSGVMTYLSRMKETV